jgi:hypothetical protein
MLRSSVEQFARERIGPKVRRYGPLSLSLFVLYALDQDLT